MTVSRTLAGGPGVSEELRQRVLIAVRELGYYRNENARSLRPGHQSGLIGIAITNLGNPYYGQFAVGVEDVAEQHGRRIFLGNTAEDPARERQLVSDFLGRQVEGLIVVPVGGEADHLTPSQLGPVPLVLASRKLAGIEADTALLADVSGAAMATRELIRRGHRRIAFLGNLVSVSTAQRRYEGYRRALNEGGLPENPALVRHGQQDLESARAAMDSLLRMSDPPTAVFCANNRNTIGAVQAIMDLRSPGEDAELPAVAGFDDFELADILPIPLLLVSHDANELGRLAGTMLFDRLSPAGADAPSRLVELPVELRYSHGH